MAVAVLLDGHRKESAGYFGCRDHEGNLKQGKPADFQGQFSGTFFLPCVCLYFIPFYFFKEHYTVQADKTKYSRVVSFIKSKSSKANLWEQN